MCAHVCCHTTEKKKTQEIQLTNWSDRWVYIYVWVYEFNICCLISTSKSQYTRKTLLYCSYPNSPL